jgi:hypothetical protein
MRGTDLDDFGVAGRVGTGLTQAAGMFGDARPKRAAAVPKGRGLPAGVTVSTPGP